MIFITTEAKERSGLTEFSLRKLITSLESSTLCPSSFTIILMGKRELVALI